MLKICSVFWAVVGGQVICIHIHTWDVRVATGWEGDREGGLPETGGQKGGFPSPRKSREPRKETAIWTIDPCKSRRVPCGDECTDTRTRATVVGGSENVMGKLVRRGRGREKESDQERAPRPRQAATGLLAGLARSRTGHEEHCSAITPQPRCAGRRRRPRPWRGGRGGGDRNGTLPGGGGGGAMPATWGQVFPVRGIRPRRRRTPAVLAKATKTYHAGR